MKHENDYFDALSNYWKLYKQFKCNYVLLKNIHISLKSLQLLHNLNYLIVKKNKVKVNPQYAIIPINILRYKTAIKKEKQFNQRLWNKYLLRKIFNKTMIVLILSLIILYIIYFGVSRPWILYNSIADNCFFGIIFPIVLSILISSLYRHVIYDQQSQHSQVHSFSRYFVRQSQIMKRRDKH